MLTFFKKIFSHLFYQVFILIALLSCNSTNIWAQNLVPNPSFEELNRCPSGLSGIDYSPTYSSFPTVKAWVNPQGCGSPDYYHSCASATSGVGVPDNGFGHQDAHFGNAYVGMYLYNGDTTEIGDYREYIECKLLQPLSAGHSYLVSFYVNLIGIVGFGHFFNIIGVDNVGAHFSKNQISDSPADCFPYTLFLSANVRNPHGNFITDTINWTKVSGVYKATGGEQWLTLGAFDDSTIPKFVVVSPGRNAKAVSYVYLDDVCVIDLADSGAISKIFDTTICTPTFPLVLSDTSSIIGTYIWSTDDTTASITLNKPGVYWRLLSNTCAFSVDTFRVSQLQQLNLGPDTAYCGKDSITLSANPNFTTYIWNTGDTTSSIIVKHNGQYILTVSDICETKKDTINIQIAPQLLPLHVADTIICQYAPSPVFHVAPNVVGATLLWYNDTTITGTATQPPINTNDIGSQILYVAEQFNNCKSIPVPIAINIISKPTVYLGNDTTICNGKALNLGIPIDSISYNWSTGETTCCITVNQSATYTLQVSNICGQNTDSINVMVKPCDSCIWVPSAFTPNGDGKNDFFRPLLRCPLQGYHLVIANRFGQIVYESFDQNNGWDGNYYGIPMEVGTYYYYAKITIAFPNIYEIMAKGDVELIR
ncbi:MAG TPA: gliding motility-associated C-terminal domain-containing protein [Flavipsychrobacter sp.]|nr:gliding motility-associated C-terminal domain-containing protein [Flavipsychrobacter sp.]